MKWPEIPEFNMKDRTILAGYVGSHSHGTYIPPTDPDGIDDKDIQGIFVPPKRFYLGLKTYEHWNGWIDEYDIVMYEAKKFFNLLLKNNPNVMSLLWIAPNLYVKRTAAGDWLIKNREIFSSKAAYKSFSGYAYSQLRKMEHHACEGYMGAKRKKLVEKFGYDTKNAAHLIRLLRMGMEFLATGELNVMRQDAGQLIDIKRGEYTLEQVKALADDLFKKNEEALIYSKLPATPNFEEAEKILIGIIEEYAGNE
jgi:predicted nucleotidyltransferase